jgi:N-acetyl sugar amidotransferase
VSITMQRDGAASPSHGDSYRICSRTVMDTSDPEIQFDRDGVCHYCPAFEKLVEAKPMGRELDSLREQTLERIRRAGRHKRFDCILGLSGGVDSSYMAYLAKSWGLRPLVVHFDNGWNNEIAVHNIQRIVSKLGFELFTFVMDWPEFRDLQRSYFKASVLDLEVPTDHMIFGALHQVASKHGINFILSGNNIATEWVLPPSWYYSKFDLVNIQAIHRRYGTIPLKKLPSLGLWQRSYYQLVRGMTDVRMLELVDYKKTNAKRIIQSELEWRDYGGKHYESIFTRFYQGYILPRKFNIDKRRAHLSNLILNGEMTRDEALAELANPTYDPDLQLQDKVYVAKKLGFSESEFEEVLTQPNRSHEEFGTDRLQRERYLRFMKTIRPLTATVKRVIGRR